MSDMTYRRLGGAGLEVSTVGLGCNNFGVTMDAAASRTVLDAALDAGVTLLDTADSYGRSEEVLGEVLAGRRDQVVIATKFGTDLASPSAAPRRDPGSRRYIRQAVERSLQRLRTDYIDLYQLHWADPLTPIAETLSTLTDLVREGKVRYIGSSNLLAWQVAEAALVAEANGFERFISAQNYYNLLDRGLEAELGPVCARYGVGILPYFPLAMGMLAGRYTRDTPPPQGSRVGNWGVTQYLTSERFDVLEKLQAFAAERGVGILDVAIGGLAAQPAVGSVIAGASSAEQIRVNAKAGQWVPTAEDLRALDEAAPSSWPRGWRHPVLGIAG
jgi:aryl-alcohol dehydrogenase-like predicted oxidoreductase